MANRRSVAVVEPSSRHLPNLMHVAPRDIASMANAAGSRLLFASPPCIGFSTRRKIQPPAIDEGPDPLRGSMDVEPEISAAVAALL